MKLKSLAIAILLTGALIGTTIAAPMLTLTTANPDKGDVVFMVKADATIPKSAPLDITISGYAISNGNQKWINPPIQDQISFGNYSGVEAPVNALIKNNVTNLTVSVSTNGQPISNCTATVSNAGQTITQAITRTLTISKTKTGYTCQVN